MRTTHLYGTTLAIVALAAAPVSAEKASQLTSINGSLGRDAEPALAARGFSYVATHKNDMGYAYSYWWDAADKSCVSVEVHEGRVESITDASAKDCGHSGGNAAAAAGVVAGAALIGALLSHKSHHHDDGQHLSDAQAEQEYERGYTDGLHNAAYHNYAKADQYTSGYQAGVDERNANLSHHTGRGGYAAAARLDDLADARAAGGMDELTRRGFRQVDNFTSGNTRYSIQWNAATRQCVQVTIADGRFYDVRDIGQNPNCR